MKEDELIELHRKYRPIDLSEVVGHNDVIDSLKRLEDEERLPHTYLFSGPAGVGKTTFARIIANILKAEAVEVDAATYSGVENVRSLTSTLRYRPMDSDKPNRVIIIDECHSLSKNAWQALLKSTEEPPSWAYFVLCTTEPSKVPKTIKTRCHAYDLKPLRDTELVSLLYDVSLEEELDLGKNSLEMIAEASGGSPRQALVYLSQCAGKSIKEIKVVLSQPGNAKEVIDFCRLLGSNKLSWSSAMNMVKDLEGKYTAESVRIVVVSYFIRVAINGNSVPNNALAILDCFSGEWPATDKYAPLLLAVGELLD